MGVDEIYGFRENWSAFKGNLKDGISAFANLSETITKQEALLKDIDVPGLKTFLYSVMVTCWCLVSIIIIWFWVGFGMGFRSGDSKSKWYKWAQAALVLESLIA